MKLRCHLLPQIPFLFVALPSLSPPCFDAAVTSPCCKYNHLFPYCATAGAILIYSLVFFLSPWRALLLIFTPVLALLSTYFRLQADGGSGVVFFDRAAGRSLRR